MLHSLGKIGLTAACFGLCFVPSVALAQDKRVRHVEDSAKLFSKDAISQANTIIAKIKEKHKKDLLIETVAEGPEKDLTGWAKARFNNAGVDGVYVVLVKKPKGHQIDVGEETLRQGYFTRADLEKLDNLIKAKGRDKELLSEIATYTLETMNERHKPTVKNPAKEKAVAPPAVHKERPGVHQDHPRESGMPPWMGMVCMIVAVLFLVWVVFAVIRAMTGMGGMGGGGYGYGGGMGYGGGGGGFFTGMLGGLFGAMAGMWIYNHMFGGHATYGPDGGVNWGGGGAAGSSDAPYQADTDVGASAGGADAGGGDWGDGGGGGDAGARGDAGGGDWGGGGDAGGGGGDWGGGGDAGGGGGDWGGGGGGGDWGGGGGGDFGGGGGGGDW